MTGTQVLEMSLDTYPIAQMNNGEALEKASLNGLNFPNE